MSQPIEPASAPPRRRGPGRPAGGNPPATREQLLSAATHFISSAGPEVTMEEIAAAANVSKPILYRTVGDKAAVVAALSKSLIDDINQDLTNAVIVEDEPRARFAAAVRAYLEAVDARRNVYLFVNAGGQTTDDLRRMVDRSAHQMIELFSATRLPGHDPSAARTWAHAIVGAFHIVSIMWLRDEYCDIDTVAEDLTDLFWPGVVTASSSG